MDYEITKVVTEPDEDGMLRVEYRTADGKTHAVRHTPSSGTPEEIAERWIQRDAEDAADAKRPPGNFEFFARLNSGCEGINTWEDMKQAYRDFAKSRGYAVDANMRPYKPAPACPPASKPAQDSATAPPPATRRAGQAEPA